MRGARAAAPAGPAAAAASAHARAGAGARARGPAAAAARAPGAAPARGAAAATPSSAGGARTHSASWRGPPRRVSPPPPAAQISCAAVGQKRGMGPSGAVADTHLRGAAHAAEAPCAPPLQVPARRCVTVSAL